MKQPTAVVELELSTPVEPDGDLHRFGDAQVLCRLHGRPLGSVRVPIEAGRLRADLAIQQLLETHGWMFAIGLAEQAVATGDVPKSLDIDRLFACPPDRPQDAPLVTVVVCTRDRAAHLRRCLDALLLLAYPSLDLLVVDNAPSDDQTEQLVREYPSIRYVREPRPGLNWARNRAILECRGDVLAYTDDDVVVDRMWVWALARVFAADPGVMAVTGLVIPDELETDAQRMFEAYGGFGRGYVRRWYRAPGGRATASIHGGAGKFGTGANMAFRRLVFDRIGGFDPALDVGTCTNGGGDLEMFFRVLKTGHTLVYEPCALVRHRHRRSDTDLRTQIANNGIGFYSYLVRSAHAYRDERVAIARLGFWWFRWWSLRRMVRAMLGKETVARGLVLAELVGSLRGLGRYRRARRQADALARRYSDEPAFSPSLPASTPSTRRAPQAVRAIDLSRPLEPIVDATRYERLRVLVSWGATPLGTVDVDHHGSEVSAAWLRDVITQSLAWDILDVSARLGRVVFWSTLIADLARVLRPRFRPVERQDTRWERASCDVAVSVVVATYDRPDDLARCLASLCAQRTSRAVQVIVVDNHPASGITPPVVARFPGVQLVEESRGGLSYARNRGVAAATGSVILSTDDDVSCPPDWIERLLSPFRQPDVMVVTGNVLPLELETDAQRMFETYGGLGRGFTPRRVDGDWFSRSRRAAPTWELGCTANAAFRAHIFRDPDIGPMDEALGAGTPTGCSEDTYVFYRVLKAGYAIVYEPRAIVWHRHRDTPAALRRQIYAYSKGHVAYHLTTWLRDGDTRGLVRIVYELPRLYATRAYHRLRGWSDYPMSFIALEILGNLAGPFALWQSRRRVRRLGTSAPSPVPHVSDGAEAVPTAAV